MNTDKDFLKDDMLNHLSKDSGYKPSVDFTDKVMDRVNPSVKPKFLPRSSSWNLSQVMMMFLPLIIAIGFLGFHLLSEGASVSALSINSLYESLISNSNFLISISIAFSASIYFIGNQLLLKYKY